MNQQQENESLGMLLMGHSSIIYNGGSERYERFMAICGFMYLLYRHASQILQPVICCW